MNRSATDLTQMVVDARARTLDIIHDLSDEQLIGPRLAIVNPLLWEIGHVAWFQEKWILRQLYREPPGRTDGDELYDSAAIPHDNRWDLPLPSRAETVQYMLQVRDRVLDHIERATASGWAGHATAPDLFEYFIQLCTFHEDMHTEAFTYTRQTLNYSAPCIGLARAQVASPAADPLRGDTEIPGGEYCLGSSNDEPFVFDNEKWLHPVSVAPLAISRAAVTQWEFAEFVEAGGYRRQELWGKEGWRWVQTVGAEQPLYWKQESPGRWLRRHFDAWVPLEPNRPVIHVNWFEASAFCNWAGRRLPTESEWELAATGPMSQPNDAARTPFQRKPRYPWGDDPPLAHHANLDWGAMECVDVAAFPAGDSPFGCRQMIGNVWEWTASDFQPYPGFSPDPYKEYSEPWFGGTHKVLRGGAFTTRSRMIRTNYRNFYTPDRRDVLAGFRTCRSLGTGSSPSTISG